MDRDELVLNPQGGYIFGYVPAMKSRGEFIQPGNIYLRIGKHHDRSGGFGIKHIWGKHQNDLKKIGYNDIADIPHYINKIITNNTEIYCEFQLYSSAYRPMIFKSKQGLVVLHPQLSNSDNEEVSYNIITAYPRFQAIGTLIGKVIINNTE